MSEPFILDDGCRPNSLIDRKQMTLPPHFYRFFEEVIDVDISAGEALSPDRFGLR